MKKLAAVLLIVLLAAGAGLWYARTTPAFAVHEIARALKACDAPGFAAHVDIGAVVSDVVDQVMGDPESLATLGGAELGGLARFAGSFSAMLKPTVAGLVEKAILDYVTSCAMFKPPADGAPRPRALALVDMALKPLAALLEKPWGPLALAAASFGVTTRTGPEATLTVPVQTLGRERKLAIALSRTGEEWRIVRGRLDTSASPR